MPSSDAAKEEGSNGAARAPTSATPAIIYVNGSRHVLPAGRGDATLLQFLRDDLRLTGTKLVCGEGGCGACTVTLVDRDTSGRVRARPVNACLFPLYAAEGAAVVTVEGLRGGSATGGSGESQLHPLPAALANAHGSQCGFCSPGFVMAAHSCLAAHAVRRMGKEGEVLKEHCGGGGDAREGARPAAEAPSPSSCLRAQKPAEDIEDVFSGNLCRCTGYRPIIDAFRPFFDEGGEGEEAASASASAAADKRRFAPPARPSGEDEKDEEDAAPLPIVDASALLPRELLTRPKPELFFPAAASGDGENGETDGGVEWHRPTSLRSLLRLRAATPQCTLVGGNTEVGIECAQKGARHAVRADVGSVTEMAALDFGGGEGEEEGEITVGAGATLEDLFEAAKGSSSGAAAALAAQLRRFAGRAVRAAAVVGGNVATASPASDLNPVFVACGASFDLASLGSESEISIRSVPAAEFFKGYRQVDLAPGEVLLRVRLPRWGGDGGLVADGAAAAAPPPSSSSLRRRRPLDFVQAFKQARRRDDDISIVTACLAVRFEARKVKRREGGGGGGDEGEEDEEAFVVSEASFCFGGVAATPLLAPRAARALVGSRWSLDDYERALRALTGEDVVIGDDAPGGAVPYRRALAASAFARFFASAHRRLLEVVVASSSGEGSSLSAPPPPLPPWLSAAAEGLPPRPPPRSLQYWDQKEEAQKGGEEGSDSNQHRVVGAPVRHLSAGLQASGAARYVADEPLPPGTLHGALVLSTRAAARVAAIDPSRALATAAGNSADSSSLSSSNSSSSSTVLFFGAADVPGTNRWGPFLGDPLFLGVGDRSEAVGLPVGIVVADSEARARRAALLVDVEYSDDDCGDGDGGSGDGDKSCSAARASKKNEPILTIDDAIAAGSFFEGMDREIERGEGDIDELFESHRREETEAGKGNAAGVTRRRVAVVEGAVRIGGQEHFYLEPHSVLVTPGEPGTSTELDVLSSTQHPYGTQLDAARAVGLPLHAVVCRATRLGGGFGGKETRAGGVAAAAAVAAVRSGRPVRLVLERHVDAAISGGRHPFFVEWRVAAEAVVEEKEKSGSDSSSSFSSSNVLSARVLAADLRLFSNGGCSPDLSGPVMERALMHCANAYNVPGRLRARGRVARTNATSNTAFRGFGAPQGMLAFECAVEQASAALGVAPELLREGSMLRDGDTTPYGTLVRECQARACWEECLRTSDFAARQLEVEAFNRSSRWIKRGLAAVPTMFGVSFTHKTYNQAGAQVSVFAADGTVLVSHGGVEMGQGLHTKVAAVAAAALGVFVVAGGGGGAGEKEGAEEDQIRPLPLSAVRVASATRTDAVPNASPTAASASSDLYGGAVADACGQLMARLRPYLLKEVAKAAAAAAEAEAASSAKEGGGNKTPSSSSSSSSSISSSTFSVWRAAVAAAYADRVDLCAHGFYATPGLGGWGSGAPFAYCSYGAAAVEAEVDCLTGNSQVRRADLVMDVGNSLNPAIDVGQVEGAFAQGLGWATTEEVVKCDAGHPWVGRGNGRGRGKDSVVVEKGPLLTSTSSSPAPAPPLSPLSTLDGSTHTRGPGTYKIPSADDAPSDLRVSLLRGSRCAATARTVHSSKAVGEPPFFLGAAAFFALKRAVASARRDALAESGGSESESGGGAGGEKKMSNSPYFRLDLPATSEALRLSAACCDDDGGGDEGEDEGSELLPEALDAVARAAGVRGRRSRVSC